VQFAPWESYCLGVLDGSILACRKIVQAVERHSRDLKRSQSDPAFAYYFDAGAAQRAVNFFAFLRHSKGEWAGQAFQLELWQAFIVACLFGWKRADGTRRFRQGYIAIPRKNGKSTTLSGLALYLLVADAEAGAEVYTIATSKEQAKLIFDESVQMRRSSPALRSRVNEFKNNLSVPATNSKYMPLTSDDEAQHGLNASACLADELHVHPTRELWDVLATSMASRRQPLMLGITTSGYDRHSFCFTQHEYSCKVLDGILRDESFFCFIAMLDEGANWEDEREWAKANPNFGKSVKIDYLRQEAQRAKNDPTALNSFLRLHLNVWTTSSERAILPDKWAACAGSGANDPIAWRQRVLDEMKGLLCYGALDLGSTSDLASEVLLFGKSNKCPETRVIPFFFVPEESIERRSRMDRIPYDMWERQGFIIATPGNVIDYHFIRETIRQHRRDYIIGEMGFDPWNATQLCQELMEDGIEMVEHRQGYISMSACTKELLKMVAGKEFAHGNNPVLAWMADNLVTSCDPAGNLKPDKSKAREKIDGIVAFSMAIGRMNSNPVSGAESGKVFFG